VTLDDIVEHWEQSRDAILMGGAGLDRAATFARQLRTWIGYVPRRFDAFEERTAVDVTGWLLDLGSALAVAGRVDEALEHCDRFAVLGNAEIFLGDQVVILSEAGRHEEAIDAANALLERFPDHAWSHVFAADAFRKTGDEARAEAGYLRALELDATDPHTVEGVLERLVPWFQRLGRGDEARRIEDRARSRLAQGDVY
jgi:tetratricopeptide (TPR) repeat protein